MYLPVATGQQTISTFHLQYIAECGVSNRIYDILALSFVLYCVVLYCILLCCIVICCIVLCCVVLCCIVLCCIVVCCILLYFVVLYCVVFCCVVLCCVVRMLYLIISINIILKKLTEQVQCHLTIRLEAKGWGAELSCVDPPKPAVSIRSIPDV